jgi:Asp-tRNA(Asn)/Glu-tRNA(Gln) amidotransferase A subunit family amidase
MQLFQLGLIDALAGIDAGNFTVSDYLESCIKRTLALEPAVGAFAYFDAAALRLQAASGQTSGALAGMPIGIKDIIATRGVPTEMGSSAFKGHIPDKSAWVVDALANAGALMFGKTVTTEFAWRHPGKTRNPWKLDHTPGGSSSGSAAAVACGCVPAALGTQTLGSVLRPAAFCGVVGYKPSYGTIPRTGVYPMATSLDHVGVFTRSVADAALLASVLTGRDGVDFAGTPSPVPAWPLAAADRPPRIALVRTAAWNRLSDEQLSLIDSTLQQLTAAGAIVTVVELAPAFDAAWSIAQTLCDAEGAFVNGKFAQEEPPRISQPSIDLVTRGKALSASTYIEARQAQRALILAFASIMAPFDAALTAPALGEAPAGLDGTGDALFCTPFSLVGAPAISLPAGKSRNGLPLGIQLVGSWGDDARLLQTATWVERHLGHGQDFGLAQYP